MEKRTMPRYIALACLLLLAPLAAQEAKTEYVNDDLKLKFVGVYGWEKATAAGSGAWTELAKYTHPQFGAVVQLLVRDNPYQTTADLRKALNEEFKGGGEDAAYKEVSIKEVEMNKGLKLPGLEVEAFATRVNEEGKKREYRVLDRTYFGRNRLFRVHCDAPRARAKRVRDLFDIALAGLEVTAEDEAVSVGQGFVSQRGGYSCVIPEGFIGVLPPSNSKADMGFMNRRDNIMIYVYAYPYRGILVDHIEELIDFYGDQIKIDKEDARVFGGKGFVATRTKGDEVTLITGTVRDGHVFRIHTIVAKDNLDAAKRAHEKFAGSFRIDRR
jgi:hypothetical protein